MREAHRTVYGHTCTHNLRIEYVFVVTHWSLSETQRELKRVTFVDATFSTCLKFSGSLSCKQKNTEPYIHTEPLCQRPLASTQQQKMHAWLNTTHTHAQMRCEGKKEFLMNVEVHEVFIVMCVHGLKRDAKTECVCTYESRNFCTFGCRR